MKPLLLVAGAGSTGRLLIQRLMPRWRTVVIDSDAKALERLGEAHPDLTLVCGDATSSLVLRQAGLEQAYALLAVTGCDDVNLEVCRLASQLFGIKTRLAIVHQPSRTEEFEQEGVGALSRAHAMALAVESRLVSGKRTASDVGIGRGEIYDVTVLATSPAVGRSLSSLRPVSWLVAAIYRKEQLVVPHGKTLIEQGDRVLLVGDPAILPSIADYMHSGTSRFPLQFGSRVVFLQPGPGDPGSAWAECLYLLEQGGALGLRVLLAPEADWRPNLSGLEDAGAVTLEGDWEANLTEILDQQDSGVLVMAPPVVSWKDQVGFGNRRFLQFLDRTREPVLIARGSFPYSHILLGVSDAGPSQRAAELALDLSRSLGARLKAVVSVPPAIVAGEEGNRRLREALSMIASMGPIYGLAVETAELTGNPVHSLLEESLQHNLLVLSHRVRQRFSFTQPDVSRHLLLRSPVSVMVLPHD
jgi:hypothetical protein